MRCPGIFWEKRRTPRTPLKIMRPEKGTKRTQRTEGTGFIPAHGGYETLLSYQKALIVFDATVHFCNRFIDKKSRTHDQMVQAARSGKQNILEGSAASGTSKEAEIKLTGVARARVRRNFWKITGISCETEEDEEWESNHKYALRLRKLNRAPDANYYTFKKGIEHPDPAICSNVIARL